MINGLQNIVVWGDSILKGIIQRDKSYKVLEENGVSLAAKKLDIEVINSSRFGSTITRGKKTMLHDLDRGMECKTAILEFGGNDCDYKWSEVSDNPEKEHLPNTPLKTFLDELTGLVAFLRERGIQPILTSLPPLVPERYFKTITSNGPDPKKILAWLGSVDYLYRWHELYSNKIVMLAGQLKCKLIDVRSKFIVQRDYGDYVCDDGIHPNEAGHRLIEQAIENAVLEFAAS